VTTQTFKKRLGLSLVVTLLLLVASGVIFAPPLFAAESDVAITANSKNIMWAVISAAASFAVGAVSAGFAISHVGAAAMGAMSEKPEIGGQALIFIALAEGLVVFGFITALMILGKV